jgi:hypothetical protein
LGGRDRRIVAQCQPKFTVIESLSQRILAWWAISVIPAKPEAEVRRLLSKASLRPALGKKCETLSKK